MLATIRITTGRENVVIESLSSRIKNANIPIKSIIHPEELRGYIFIEGESEEIESAIKNVPHIRGLINKPVPLNQVERFLVPEKSEVKFEIGDIIEIVSAQFKGEKGKITRVDDTKNMITVEFLEAAIPIPVTIPMNSVRMEKKAGK
ncbi:MAG: transcription elongation factor Spt5 [Candidatus Aenigmarchaeota archaeon]|nr:transcription elongation factor Spt5 [Candidatus Aenigmarchaeota archaeon]